ncbi:hypothetical protein IDJ77_21750 [Mucilaginibacter sp. ZT4R22]|uniref:Uncharacterized protein n=1 Tax=Mucilaginibacter pankratovii TaxID=2772110 RepID=A0ABR7WW81_9SPHI|nr:DUF6660 family protein [Mucilaginibacter pankratovii]MBD1366453.1 hypothetical protein [Mucilaginibacter pankratovii]
MKFLCILFSVYVLLLSVRPCCADDCIAKPITKKEIAGNNAKPGSDCQGCSPFFSCGTCVGFPLVNRVISVENTAAEIIVEHNSTYKQPALKPVTLSIWQPPQLS